MVVQMNEAIIIGQKGQNIKIQAAASRKFVQKIVQEY